MKRLNDHIIRKMVFFCRENPLEGFTALRELELVVRGGARIERPQIKKMPDVERELDKCL